MSKIKFSGPVSMRIKRFLVLNKIAISTYIRHAIGKPMAPDWDANLEIGIRFCRDQFTRAMTMPDIAKGRLLFDSVQLETDDKYDVDVEPSSSPKGHWYHPKNKRREAMLLYFHGGGYTFHAGVSKRFAAMLAHHTGASLFAPDYRLTPEHPHPAQSDDAFSAWKYMCEKHEPENMVVIGDSAGGHMALMLLQRLKAESLSQPSLCIGLCPWTDIGDRGKSLQENNRYDLVQGWMALQFGEWLDPAGTFGREALSPIYHDYSGLAPIYLQTGGREVLRDMIMEFHDQQKAKGANVTLDVWHDMPHDFQAYDNYKTSSAQSLDLICKAIENRLK